MADKSRQTSSKQELSLTQRNAIDLLITGRNDRETAEVVGVARQTVTAWRLYDVAFRAALNQARSEVWSATTDQLRALIPQALHELEAAFGGRDGVRAAIAVLRLVGGDLAVSLAEAGPSDPDEIVREEADRRHGLVAMLRPNPGDFVLQQTRRELDEQVRTLVCEHEGTAPIP